MRRVSENERERRKSVEDGWRRLHLLLTPDKKIAVSVDWSERAEQFTLFLHAVALEGLMLTEILRHMRRGH